ncbi:unnamed protein product [Closterium sp. NIES-53]
MYLMTCTRPDLAFPLSVLSRFVATGRHRPVHWTAAVRVAKYLASTSGMGLVLGGIQPVVLTGLRSSSVASSSAQAEIYAGAMVAQKLRWLTFLLADLGERPRSALALYRCGQARLDFVASEANTVDVYTKALAPGDHHRFCVQLGLVDAGVRLL